MSVGPGENNLFALMVAGKIPCHKVAECEHWLALLDINPLSEGHTLIIPRKENATKTHELSAESMSALGPFMLKVIKAVVPEGGDYNILQNNGSTAGQVVMYVHYHIIPRRAEDGLSVNWNAKKADPERLKALAQEYAEKFKALP